jgi:transposase
LPVVIAIVQVTHAAARSKNTRFGAFFLRKMHDMGFGKTIVALARKIITIVWHLMVNDEEYEEQGDYGKPDVRIPKSKDPRFLSLDEILTLIRDANVFLKSPDPDGEPG